MYQKIGSISKQKTGKKKEGILSHYNPIYKKKET
jgi:hypothetical protein